MTINRLHYHLAVRAFVPLLVSSVSLEVCVACLLRCVGVVHVLATNLVDAEALFVKVGADE